MPRGVAAGGAGLTGRRREREAGEASVGAARAGLAPGGSRPPGRSQHGVRQPGEARPVPDTHAVTPQATQDGPVPRRKMSALHEASNAGDRGPRDESSVVSSLPRCRPTCRIPARHSWCGRGRADNDRSSICRPGEEWFGKPSRFRRTFVLPFSCYPVAARASAFRRRVAGHGRLRVVHSDRAAAWIDGEGRASGVAATWRDGRL